MASGPANKAVNGEKIVKSEGDNCECRQETNRAASHQNLAPFLLRSVSRGCDTRRRVRAFIFRHCVTPS